MLEYILLSINCFDCVSWSFVERVNDKVYHMLSLLQPMVVGSHVIVNCAQSGLMMFPLLNFLKIENKKVILSSFLSNTN